MLARKVKSNTNPRKVVLEQARHTVVCNMSNTTRIEKELAIIIWQWENISFQ